MLYAGYSAEAADLAFDALEPLHSGVAIVMTTVGPSRSRHL